MLLMALTQRLAALRAFWSAGAQRKKKPCQQLDWINGKSAGRSTALTEISDQFYLFIQHKITITSSEWVLQSAEWAAKWWKKPQGNLGITKRWTGHILHFKTEESNDPSEPGENIPTTPVIPRLFFLSCHHEVDNVAVSLSCTLELIS